MHTPETHKFCISFLLLLACSSIAWGPWEDMNTAYAGIQQQQLPPDTGTSDTIEEYEPDTRPNFNPSDRWGDPYSGEEDVDTPLWLEDPPNVKEDVEMTSDTTMVLRQTMGDSLDMREPSVMSYEDYMDESAKKARRKYYRDKLGGGESEDAMGDSRDGLIPKVYLPKSMDRIFGGNYVDIRPNGSVMLDFGLQWQRTENPALPIRQQRNFQFRFDQQIAFNLQGTVGEKLKITANWDTKANFGFENNVTIDYTGLEYEILKDVEAGNISMPVGGSLISGVQNLFGFKTVMQFGRLRWTAVAAQQRGERQQKNLNGGSQITQIDPIRVDEYDDYRHYFLGHFFRDNYEPALRNIPEVVSGVVVNRVEVYKTNRDANTRTARNIVAFTDLGECRRLNRPGAVSIDAGACGNVGAANNDANDIYNKVRQGRPVIDPSDVDDLVRSEFGGQLIEGEDYEVVRGAQQLQQGLDYEFNKELGYISLNTPVREDEVLAVAVEYAFRGRRFVLGEFAQNYSSPNTQCLVLKLLKPSTVQTRNPSWDLQMKNVYSLQGGSITQDGFRMQVVYRDDSSGRDNPTFVDGTPGEGIRNEPILQVLNADRINPTQQLQPDGNWDYLEGVTVDSRRGRLIFPVLEPFGGHLRQAFRSRDPQDSTQLINKYIFNELYDSTQADALLAADKAKFFITGRMQSTTSNTIRIPPFTTRGSVRIYVGTSRRELPESAYTVDYNTGIITILDEGVLASGEDIQVDYEKPDLIQFQPKSFFGSRFDYKVNDNINLGATVMHLAERPVITRVSAGSEPSNNTIWGLDANVRHESRLLTRAVDLLPLIQTKEKSTVTVNAEYAQIHPGYSRMIGDNNGTAYIDDFEGSERPFNMAIPINRWLPSSPPAQYLNPTNPIRSYDNRAKFAYYSIDDIFYRENSVNAQDIPNDELDNDFVALIPFDEIFRNRDPQAINLNQRTLDLAFYPEERGMYNFNTNLTPDGRLRNPRQSWGGMTRAIFQGNTDFDNANIQYIQFWIMDPFIEDDISGNTDIDGRRGKLVLNLGNISEDVIIDDQHTFENGLPVDGSKNRMRQTDFGYTTEQQWVTEGFDNREGARNNQDIGLDGLTSEEEQRFHQNYVNSLSGIIGDPTVFQEIQADPAGDDFRYYLEPFSPAGMGILERYKDFNGLENNSPASDNSTPFTPSFTNLPDDEDLNDDRQVSTTNGYYEYTLNITPKDLRVGRNYISDKIESKPGDGDRTWYLVRIPIRNLDHPNAGKVGRINSFKSIRYIRAYMSGFSAPTVLRTAQFELISNQWRPYTQRLEPQGGFGIIDEPSPDIVIGTVNIEENGATVNEGEGIPYVLPPGVDRDRDVASNVNRRLNETSMSLCIDNLKDSDARAVFKNVSNDFINYKRMRMYIHAESEDPNTKDDDLVAFVRLGTDFTQNYYEVQIPLTMTQQGERDPGRIWPSENEVDVAFEDFFDLKEKRNSESSVSYNQLFGGGEEFTRGKQELYIKGNPDLSSVTIIMIGIRNPTSPDRLPKSTCLWVNELRVTDFIRNKGWAATSTVNAKLADFSNVTLSGRFSSIGFGKLEDAISDRNRENTASASASSTVQLDKFVPKEVGLKLPMYVGYEVRSIDPQFDPLNPDRQINSSPNLGSLVQTLDRNEEQEQARDLTTKRSINFTNVRKVKTKKDAKSYPWDVENLNLTYAYSETKRRNATVETSVMENWRYGLGYNYTNSLKPIQPFKKSKWASGKALKFLKQFNFSPLPRSISFRADLDRRFTKDQYRALFPNEVVEPFYSRVFRFNRSYNLGWSPFRSLNINYTANITALIDEPYGEHNEQDKDSVWNNLKDFGRMQNFNQNVRANYRLPTRSIPFLDFVNADVTYGFGTTWQAQTLGLIDEDSLPFGNQLQNNRERAINGKIDLLRLYNKSKFLKKINQPPRAQRRRRRTPQQRRRQEQQESDTTEKPREWKGLKYALRGLMMLRSININYSVNENTSLPGYMPSVNMLGFDGQWMAPGLDFLLGSQDASIRRTAAENNWLSPTLQQIRAFQQMTQTTLNARATLEPFEKFRIQLDAKRTETNNYSELFRNNNDAVQDAGSLEEAYQVADFESLNPSRMGSYEVTYIAFGSTIRNLQNAISQNDYSTQTNDEFMTPEYGRFLVYRQVVADRLNRGIEGRRDSISRAEFSPNNQDAVIPAFLAAYSGRPIKDVGNSPFPQIPLPNWRIDYAGLSKMDFFKRFARSINLTHSYVSTYSVNNFVSNLQYDKQFIGPDTDPLRYNLPTATRDNTSDEELSPIYDIGMVRISERFTPFLGVNARLKNKMTIRLSYNRERNYMLNTNNSQLTEQRVWGVTLGLGWTKAGVKVPLIHNKGRDIILDNDLSMRLDMSYRDNVTIQRSIDNLLNTVTDGVAMFQLKPTISYQISDQLNLQMYFDRTVNIPKISTSYPRYSSRFGLQLRLTLG